MFPFVQKSWLPSNALKCLRLNWKQVWGYTLAHIWSHVSDTMNAYIICSADRASWCLAHRWWVTLCKLLIGFHCSVSSLHSNYADRQCIMIGHTIRHPLSQHISKLHVYQRAPANMTNAGDLCTVWFHRPPGITGKKLKILWAQPVYSAHLNISQTQTVWKMNAATLTPPTDFEWHILKLKHQDYTGFVIS